ncbi:zonular occludens toxin domain-containing protein [Neisseria gonorrhoeae]|uniref:zonular occludens toxin domain-containing protein n=1 Tax=Neisseria gonorrhoeae TaxID=485 RepID=UPI0021D7BBBD|nr:zonular occludens toxin domain-containing protein [Neisseria gonorrhoeae]UXY76934.1 zonular occludens toxin domain-containing protein [Neisseria gonorrhoeae]
MSAPLRDVIPEGAVLIVGEAHYTYPVRAQQAVCFALYIQELTELRHHGHTVILMTRRRANLIYSSATLFQSMYTLNARQSEMKQYYWYKCVTSLDNPAGVSGVEAANWKPPKEAFKYYKSSSQHQKFKKKVPWAVWALIAVVGFVGWKSYGMFQFTAKPQTAGLSRKRKKKALCRR